MSAAALLEVVGVRHHSPVCARVVARVIARRRPRHVLVEGPSDMNGRVDELTLPHAMPIAVFTYARDAAGAARAVWSPFCAHSPEWVAFAAARDVGAEARFMDLPAWDEVFSASENRYGDHAGDAARARRDAYLWRLCQRLRVDDVDALWDHLFELTRDDDDLDAVAARLDAHFDALRGDAPAGPRDGPREAFMLRCLGWALRDAEARGGTAQEGGVVAVCGGWHRPALLAGAAAALVSAPDAYPEAPPPADSVDRYGSYLVPYSHRRLDSLAGYASGMPSPGFYGQVWQGGAERASERALGRIAARLRKRKQLVSTADLVACHAAAQALARVRAHAVVARSDLLDAVASTLVKRPLDVEVPWARRGPLRPGTDPVLVEVALELAGSEIGRLAPGVRRPPLSGDVDAELARLELVPEERPRHVTLDLSDSFDLARSRALHRLRVLEIPGFARAAGPRLAVDRETSEAWTIARVVDAESKLVEAASFGASLEQAARGAIAARAEGNGAAALASILADALFTGLLDLASGALAALEQAIRAEPELGPVGQVLREVHAVHRHGALVMAAGHAALACVLEAGYDRGLWLLEGIGGGAGYHDDDVKAVGALRDVALAKGLAVDTTRARGVFERRVADAAVAPCVRGACLGALVSTGAHLGSGGAVMAVRRTPPKELGDLLAGLFALAREEMLVEPDLVRVVDDVIRLAAPEDFAGALPALRFAFQWFPPRERARIAERVAALHGLAAEEGRDLAAPLEHGSSLQHAELADAAAAALARRFGLADALDAEAGA